VFEYGISIAFGLSQGGIVPSYTIILRRFFPPREAGWRISTSFLFTIAGMAFGGWIAGLLYDLTGSYFVSFLNAIGFNILNLWIAAGLLQKTRKSRTNAATTTTN
jgi:MFS family permease